MRSQSQPCGHTGRGGCSRERTGAAGNGLADGPRPAGAVTWTEPRAMPKKGEARASRGFRHGVLRTRCYQHKDWLEQDSKREALQVTRSNTPSHGATLAGVPPRARGTFGDSGWEMGVCGYQRPPQPGSKEGWSPRPRAQASQGAEQPQSTSAPVHGSFGHRS